MLWADALKEVDVIEQAGAGAEIARVEYDSRRVKPGAAFVAMRGGTTDGNRYIDAAIGQGAVAIVTDSAESYARLRRERPAMAVARVEHGRRALAQLAAAVLGHPERTLKVSAVTGTNGKTTVAYLLEQLLRSAGRKCVLIGTIETRIGDDVRPSEHTTPEASDLLAIFADGVRAGATEVVMEMSSHALDQERVLGIPVDVGIFTNLTQDHLDYHGTMERYAAAKAKLFEGVGTPVPRVAVLNADDSASAQMQQAFRGIDTMTYGMGPTPLYHAQGIRETAEGARFQFDTTLDSVPIQSPLHGRINVSNLLAAMCAALARGMTLDEIAAAVPKLEPAPGRFEVVQGSKEAGSTVVVDYAHTDDALRNLISLARELVAPQGGRVITLFGCGGDRDRTKRPKMGRAAGEGSDLVILTSDNPRSEEPTAIIEEALAGVRETATECIVEADRAAAIAIAIRAARPGDVVLLAGKGHEKVQILRERTVPFDDVEVARQVLREMR
ncbi:MAG TPA: UDP-N-acetylmuramoyl-L-alanyl-D-glutamate--2,6-diaminopimelate ligase [Acidobacteriaceae bacterium]|nr:UDP-N-acetylmuramoyl-L-alanyl-D-glutamate--2,6-diaminopimelate ligase [Acidobacteriaceae bacterium]